MKLLRLLPLLLCLPAAAFAGAVASVNFKALNDDLRDYYLAKPENAALREQFDASVADEKAQSEAVMTAVAEGKTQLDLRKTMESGLKSASRFELRRKIDAALKKELYRIISDMGLAYEVIYDSSNSDAILFAKTGVDDITVLVRQALAKAEKLP